MCVDLRGGQIAEAEDYHEQADQLVRAVLPHWTSDDLGP